MEDNVAEIRIDDLQAGRCPGHRVFGLQDGIDDTEVGNAEYAQRIRRTVKIGSRLSAL